jgi:hypothetical protein
MDNSINEYTFPFDTCEKSNKSGIAQPFSAFTNLLNCAIILYFLLKTKTKYAFILLFSILCFELFHVFSHTMHISGSLQINITHLLSYCINFSFFYLFYNYTNILPNYIFIVYILLLICFDIYSLYNLSIVFYIITQALLFLSVLFYYYSYLPKSIQNNIYYIVFLVFLIIILFLNEKYNCKAMLNNYPNFPFHILIEILGIILFYIISQSFYNL